MGICKSFIALVSAILMSLGLISVDTVDIGSVPPQTDGTVRVVSFNLRTADDIYGSVKNRSAFVTQALKQYAPDSFGVQEANKRWLGYLDGELSEKYARVGEGRDSSKNTEYSCVYYLKDKYNLLDSGTIWLSETPDKPGSKSFASSFPRICTWAVLENKETGTVYTHINTHLDHLLECTRQKQAEVLLKKVDELSQRGQVVLTGDFNTSENSKTYNAVSSVLDDTRLTAVSTESGKTFHNYGRGDLFHDSAIDFIFVTKGTEVASYHIMDNMANGMYLSDHYGLCSDIYFK